jgi:hypothetical protein
MPKYKVIKTSNSINIESAIVIEADTLEQAQVRAQEFVEEYNNLGNGHEDNWVLKSVIVITDTAPPSDPTPEPIIEAPPRDPE